MLRGIRNLIAFLTIIPVGEGANSLVDAANYMYLSPIVGALIGFLAGFIGWVLLQILPSLIAGALTLGFLLLITGLHHTDGLLDFGDGLVVQGPPEKKIKAMHDQQTGAGGFALGLVTLLITFLCITELGKNVIVKGLIVAEVSAKLAMVIEAWAGKSAHVGLNTYFINAMRKSYRRLRLIVALLVSLGIATLLLFVTGLIVIIVGVVTALIMLWISNRHFNGVTGDVMGATNEITRMISLLTLLVIR